MASRRLITGIASSSHTVEYTSFGEAVRSLANFHVKQKAATSLSSINSSQRKLSARGSCRAMLSTNPIAIATRPQGVNIISKVVNPPNGCYAQYIRGSILSLPTKSKISQSVYRYKTSNRHYRNLRVEYYQYTKRHLPKRPSTY